jgi:PmbA protein
VEQISGEVISRAKEFLSPMAISGGKTPVILSKRISAKIISIYLSSFHASKAQKGLSRLKGRLNEEIASEKFSLFSEPLLPALSGFKLMDDEGIPTAALNIVENGVFNSFLYNLESASKENRKSTGHGERSFSGKAGTSFINAVVPLSNLSNKEILSLFPKCLLINHLEGSSGCNPVSGEISIGVQGFWCENGIPVHAVDNLTVSTNFFDLLKNIVGIGSEYNDSFSNVKVPSLAISEMSVAS